MNNSSHSFRFFFLQNFEYFLVSLTVMDNHRQGNLAGKPQLLTKMVGLCFPQG